MKVNGEAVYASRPFEVYGEHSIRYTRNSGYVYATVLDWKDSVITLKALHAGGSTIGKVSKVELIGSDVSMSFTQNDKGLTVTPNKAVMPLPGIADQSLASGSRVLRITHDKDWFNDDDPGVVATGWTRRANLGAGDYNNDLTISDRPGDVWTTTFGGEEISVIAPTEPGAGKMEIIIDGQRQAMVNLSAGEARQPQQQVFKSRHLSSGRHTIEIINEGKGPVAIDAVIVEDK